MDVYMVKIASNCGARSRFLYFEGVTGVARVYEGEEPK
jgi:hypothetical protein